MRALRPLFYPTKGGEMMTDKLDAVNIILSAIGSDPISSLEDTTDIDVANALRFLDKVSRQVQRQGWDFNMATTVYYPNLEDDNKILYDDTLLAFKSADGLTISKRGNYFYNNSEDTYEFPREIRLNTIVLLDFDDLPDCFKNYIAIKSALEFQTRYMPDGAVSQALQFDVGEAYADIVEYDIQMSKPNNYLQFPQVAGILDRS